MTVAVKPRRKDYAEDGVTVAFAVPWRFNDPADVKAQRTAADGTRTDLTYGVNYSVTGGKTDAGGTLTLGAAGPLGGSLSVWSETSRAQTAEYPTSGTFPAETHEGVVDQLAMAIQEQDAEIDRSVRVPRGSEPVQLDPLGLTDGDLLEYRDGQLQRFDTSPFAGRYYAGDVDGRFIGASGAGADSALRSDLATGVGGSMVGWLRAATGAVVRSIGDWFEDQHSIMDYIPLIERVKIRLRTSTADLSVYLQQALDNMTLGGELVLPRGSYNVRSVTVANRGVKVRLAAGTYVKKFGAGAVPTRGIFMVLNLPNAGFELEGAGKHLSVIDLNDEGPMEIGVAGRNPNEYANMTVPGTKGIKGLGNSVIYALRSTHVTARGLSAINTNDSLFLFRNCSDTLVADSYMRNAAHFGVEWSLTTAGVDGGSAPMPDRSRQRVERCDFRDMPDWALGTGNGNGVGGFGGPEPGVYYDYDVLDCTFDGCQRDVHYEMASANAVIDGAILRLKSRNARQGCLGLVDVRNARADIEVINAGGAPTAVLSPNYADVFGFVISGPETDNVVINAQVVDRRNSKAYYRADGAMVAGSRILSSAGATFTTTARIGMPFGVLGAGPEGSCLVTTVRSIVDDTHIELELPNLSGGNVASAEFAYGGATRWGGILNNGGSVKINGRLHAGIQSTYSRTLMVEGIPTVVPEPGAAGFQIAAAVFGHVDTSGLSISAPQTQGTTPTGVKLANFMTGAGALDPRQIRVRGFTNPFVGLDNYRTSCIGPSTVSAAGLAVEPAAGIDTFGAEEFIVPHGDRFSQLLGGIFDFDLTAETVTLRVSAYLLDGGANTVDIASTVDGESKALTELNLWQLNRDNAPLLKIGVKAKSSIAGSVASVGYRLRALEG